MLLDRKGRTHVVLGATLFLLGSLVTGSLTVALGTTKPVVLLVRLTIAGLLALAMLKGASWARWVMAFLGGAGGLYAAVAAISLASRGSAFPALILGAMSLFYLGTSAFLAFSPSVASYFREPLISPFSGEGGSS